MARLVETQCRRDHEFQFQAFNSWFTTRQRSPLTVTLSPASFVEEIWNSDFTGPQTTTNHCFFRMKALESPQVAFRSKCGTFTYLHTHWARNESHRWTKIDSRAHIAKRCRLCTSSGFSSCTSCTLDALSLRSRSKKLYHSTVWVDTNHAESTPQGLRVLSQLRPQIMNAVSSDGWWCCEWYHQ